MTATQSAAIGSRWQKYILPFTQRKHKKHSRALHQTENGAHTHLVWTPQVKRSYRDLLSHNFFTKHATGCSRSER